METDFKRITADFSPEAYEVLSNVARKLRTTKADTLRRALGLINFILREQSNGWKIILENKEGTERKEIITL